MWLLVLCLVVSRATGLKPATRQPSLSLSAMVNSLLPTFGSIDLRTARRMRTIIDLFREEQIDAASFHGVNGYGYGDIGREKFDRVMARLLGAEAAMTRLQFFSGTHAISTALFASLRPGDDFLCVSGKPYDTLEEVIGLRINSLTGSTVGSLRDWGIGYGEIPLLRHSMEQVESKFDLEAITAAVRGNSNVRLVHIQRSCGYQWRPSITIKEIGLLCSQLRAAFPHRSLIIFCDNCYGELVEDTEPCHVGVDLVAGSLIKNLGGTIAPAGGYVAGRRNLVAACGVHLAAPGVEGGATFNQYHRLFQGLFMAPVVVGESLKGAELLASAMTNCGYDCNPRPLSPRTDIIQAIKLGDRSKVLAFCETVQRNSPVGSYVTPVPGNTPGYADEVIFADGSFVEGSTLELTADAPLRPPYVVYSQGCIHWSQWATILEELMERKEFLE